MKILLIVCLFLLLLITPLSAQQKNDAKSGNPVLNGWYADPEAIIFGKQYWIYPTYSDVAEKQLYFDAFSSTDLVNWTTHKKILDASDFKWVKKAMWAPAIVKKDKKYYLFFGANDIHENQVGGIGVGVSDKPEGPFKDLIGEPLIGKFYNGTQPIDQSVFQDKDKQYYIIYGGWEHCNIGKLNKDFTAIVPFADGCLFKEITPENYVEGPMMFIRGGKYYFMWSEGNWTGPDYRVAYAVADSPFGPFKRIGTILQEDKTVATGAGHHSIMNDAKKDFWYIVYHRRPLGEKAANHRVTCIERFYFDNKGMIQPVKLSFEGVPKQKLK